MAFGQIVIVKVFLEIWANFRAKGPVRRHFVRVTLTYSQYFPIIIGALLRECLIWGEDICPLGFPSVSDLQKQVRDTICSFLARLPLHPSSHLYLPG